MIILICTNFNNIKRDIFVIIFNIINFVNAFVREFNNIFFEFKIKMYTLFILIISIFFRVIKIEYIEITFIFVNNNRVFYNIRFRDERVTIIFSKIVE